MDKEKTLEKIISIELKEIMKEAERIEESAQLTAKAHFISAHHWKRMHYFLGLPMFILASVLGTTAFSAFDNAGQYIGVLSIVMAILAALMTFLNPNERFTNHLNAGNFYSALENDVRIFRTIECWKEDPIKIFVQKVRSYSQYRDQLNATSPQVPWLAYIFSKTGIWMGEARYKVDKPCK